MNKITFRCDNIEEITTSHYDSQMKVTIINPVIEDTEDLDIIKLLGNTDHKELFAAIIENDEEILHKYLEQHGYMFNKA